MSQIFTDNSLTIGGTPMVRLNRIVPTDAEVYAKIEGRNPAYSEKSCTTGRPSGICGGRRSWRFSRTPAKVT